MGQKSSNDCVDFDFSLCDGTGNISVLKNYGIVPATCLHRIFLYLGTHDLSSVMRGCGLFHRIVNTTLFWNEYLKAHMGGEEYEQIVKEVKKKSDMTHESNVNYKKLFFNYFRFPYVREDSKLKEVFKEFRGKNLNNTEFHVIQKFLLVGDESIGKSMLMLRFVDDVFSESYIYTIGVDFKIALARYEGKIIKLQIWDTSGMKRFQTITQTYHNVSQGIFVCFDLSNEKTFEGLPKLMEYTKSNCNVEKPPVIMVVGLKADLERKVGRNEVFRFLRKHRIPLDLYCECSSKNSEGVFYPFGKMMETIMKSTGIEEKSK